MNQAGDEHGQGRPSEFDSACAQAVHFLKRQNEETLDVEDDLALNRALGQVISTLPRLLSRRVVEQPGDVQDVASEAITRFIAAVQRGMVSETGSPSGYLLTIAANVIRDRQRRAPLPMPMESFVFDAQHDPLADLEDLGRVLDSIASHHQVRAAVVRAGEVGDRTVLEVVEVWLNLAASKGDAPTVREVAVVLGVSKSGVALALKRLRTYLSD